MRVIGYVRVSSDAQAQSGASIEAQEQKIRAMAEIKSHPLLEIITDAGESAKDLERPGMQRLLAMVAARQVDMVIVAKIDRISRDIVDAGTLVKTFEKNGVQLVSIAEGFDMSTAVGRAMMGIIVVFAAMERELIGERTATALQQIKRSGCPAGPAPFGFTAQPRPKLPDGKRQRMPLIPNEAERHTVRQIMKRRGEVDEDGRPVSVRRIADELNAAGYRTRRGGKWHFTAVGRIIRQQTQSSQTDSVATAATPANMAA